MRRDWERAYDAHFGKPCRGTRIAGHTCRGRIQLAHVSGRAYDAWLLDRGLRRRNVKVVDPLDVVPLCEQLHDGYDRRTFPPLDLLPLLDPAEVYRAVAVLGLGMAMRRIQNTRDWTLPDPYVHLGEVNAA